MHRPEPNLLDVVRAFQHGAVTCSSWLRTPRNLCILDLRVQASCIAKVQPPLDDEAHALPSNSSASHALVSTSDIGRCKIDEARLDVISAVSYSFSFFTCRYVASLYISVAVRPPLLWDGAKTCLLVIMTEEELYVEIRSRRYQVKGPHNPNVFFGTT